jgi:hypothetical protein
MTIFPDENYTRRNIWGALVKYIMYYVRSRMQQKLDCVKIWQAKYFTDNNIPIYGILYVCAIMKMTIHCCSLFFWVVAQVISIDGRGCDAPTFMNVIPSLRPSNKWQVVAERGTCLCWSRWYLKFYIFVRRLVREEWQTFSFSCAVDQSPLFVNACQLNGRYCISVTPIYPLDIL